MGKKKHHGKHDRPEPRFEVPPEIAGLAAMALRQVDTPAFRQMMAGALGAAAQAFDQRRPAAAPVPPVRPEPPATQADAAPHPDGDKPDTRLPPEAAQAIEQAARQLGQAIESAAALAARAVETAAEGLARWTEQQRGRPAEDGERPHG